MPKTWTAVDRYFEEQLIPADPILKAVRAANRKAGLPAIDVSPLQGRFLELLVRITGAHRVLEIGTLGGYSSIWLARALPQGGSLLSLELDPHHASVARGNLKNAGVADRTEIRVGPGARLTGLPDRGRSRALRPHLHRRPTNPAIRLISNAR